MLNTNINKMKNKILFTLGLLLVSSLLKAQINAPPLVTDRPDQTESAAIVAKGKLQLETGFVYEYDEGEVLEMENYTYNSTLLRYGLTKSTELRVGMEYLDEKLITQSGQEFSFTGLSPLYTGLKVKIAEEQGIRPDMALLGSLTWPATANKDLEPQFVAPALRMSFAHTLSDNLSLGYNLGAEWDGDNPEASYFYSIALGIGVTEKLGAFVESYGSLYKDRDPEHKADTGLTYLVSNNFQLDVSGGIGLSENAPDYFASFGFSYRIPE